MDRKTWYPSVREIEAAKAGRIRRATEQGGLPTTNPSAAGEASQQLQARREPANFGGSHAFLQRNPRAAQ